MECRIYEVSSQNVPAFYQNAPMVYENVPAYERYEYIEPFNFSEDKF